MLLGAMALWLFLSGFVGASIIVATTSGAPVGGVDAAVQSAGGFYLTTVRTLREFAVSTTVSPRWVDAGYAALSSILLVVHLFFSWAGATLDVEGGPSDAMTGLFLLVPLVLPLGAAVFYLGAQLLTIGILSLGVGFIPLMYGGIFGS